LPKRGEKLFPPLEKWVRVGTTVVPTLEAEGDKGGI
jgi:hypothetical protein